MVKPEAQDAKWTFLSNHGHLLVHLSRQPDAKIKEMAEAIGITERRTQSILADLEDSGYVTITRTGRRNTYQVNAKKKFRHPAEADKSVSELLRIFK
jgi:DNA-binding MarR family transcriptional regulator